MRHSSDIVLALLLVVVISVLDILIRQLSLTIVLISFIAFTQILLASIESHLCEVIVINLEAHGLKRERTRLAQGVERGDQCSFIVSGV